CANEVHKMEEADGNEHHAGGAVDIAAHQLVDENNCQPGRRILQRKSGKHQGEEADEQREVLNPLQPRHAEQNPWLPNAVQDEFLAPRNQVVQHHTANHAHDHPEVKTPDQRDDLGSDIGLGGAVEVHFAAAEVVVGAGMALAASLGQVGVIDG